jgi:ubiquinone/menaquinone biosynthesis C-methylase UbiE
MERLRRRLGELRGKRVFEPGCGAGPLTRRLAEWVGPYGRVLALDSCEGMTARCERVVNGHGHVEVRRGFAENEVLEEKAWDLVLCFRLYPHLDNPMKFLQQCRRGLVPEGDLVGPISKAALRSMPCMPDFTECTTTGCLRASAWPPC